MWNSIHPAEFRLNNFGALRLGLAALVVVAHSFVAANGSNDGAPLFELTGKRLDLGALAVNGFFIASGFMVSESLARGRGFADFIRKRLLRLYPAFVLLWLLQSFLLAPLFSAGSFSGYSARQSGILLFNLATLSSYGYPYGGLLRVFPENPAPGELNVSLWTLRYEFSCYVFLGLAGVAGIFRRRWLVTGLFGGFWLILAAGIPLPWHRILTALLADGAHWPRFATYFLAGVTFWHWRKEIPRHNGLAAGALALMLCGFLSPAWLDWVLPVGWTYLLMWLAYLPTPGLRQIGARTDVSYGTYLYAFPIQQMMMVLMPKATAWPVVALSLPAAIVAGFVSWHLVEKRFLGRSSTEPRSVGIPTHGSAQP
jgi:peptidoglycan/LPS O-acetylase OafA/YrhL